MAGGTPSAVARYYDALTRYVGLAARLRLGRAEPLTMHRRLHDADGRPAGERLHALLFAELGAADRLLDAGCGVGGTLFAWAARGGSGCGLTVSALQCARAEAAAARRALGARCRFYCASYDGDLAALLGGERFGAIVAIESLIHAADPARTVANLAARLAPGGRFALVDDMTADGAAADDADLRAFQRRWLAPGLRRGAALRAIMERCGLRIVADRDLTADIERRAAAHTAVLARLNRAGRALLPIAGARAVLDAHYGGLVLERLYARGLMRYRLIVGEASA